LELALPLGTTVMQGANGHGKSNLLEAIYMMAIAKSPKVTTDRELINKFSVQQLKQQELSYSKIGCVAEHTQGSENLEIHYRCQSSQNIHGFIAQKFIRINGSPKKSSELVGIVNAVLFSVGDLDLIYGSPSVRRRYLDILLSQVDKEYLLSIQQYQKANTQRNHLLRSIRDGSSSANELTFWDQQLAKNAVILTRKRQEAVEILEGTSLPFHKLLGGSNEKMNIRYARTYDFSENIDLENFMKSLEQSRRRDIAQGSTSIGPHRDDLIFEVDNMEASKYASRGQSRTAILALKMAESEFLYTHRSTKPVLLLDDVMSELDQTRREQLVEHLKNHDQVIMTTAEPSNIPDSFTNSSNRLEVINGSVKTI
jgi:DNA replication and repair protein RecF